MTYTVSITQESGREMLVDDNLSRSAAVRLARETAKDASGQVYISWFRPADGQLGYLNPDGHDPVGHPW